LITTLNKTGEQISHIAKLTFQELTEKVSGLSEKDLYPQEENKLATSLFILKQAFGLQVQDVLFHEFDNLKEELKNDQFRLKVLISDLIVPFYEYIIEVDEKDSNNSSFCRTIYSLIAEHLKTVLAQVIDEFQKNKVGEDDTGPILVGSSGTVKGEIDSLIVCIKSYLNNKEAMYIGPLVSKDMISEFIDNMSSKKVVITDRYVSFRPHPRFFDLMKDMPSEKLQDVEFAVLLHRLNEMQRFEFENSDKVEILNSFDSMDQYFAS